MRFIITITIAAVLTVMYVISRMRQIKIDEQNGFMYTKKQKEMLSGKKKLYVNEKGELTNESFSEEILNNNQ